MCLCKDLLHFDQQRSADTHRYIRLKSKAKSVAFWNMTRYHRFIEKAGIITAPYIMSRRLISQPITRLQGGLCELLLEVCSGFQACSNGLIIDHLLMGLPSPLLPSCVIKYFPSS